MQEEKGVSFIHENMWYFQRLPVTASLLALQRLGTVLKKQVLNDLDSIEIAKPMTEHLFIQGYCHDMQKLAQHQRQLWRLANSSNLSKICWSYIQQQEPTDSFHHFFGLPSTAKMKWKVHWCAVTADVEHYYSCAGVEIPGNVIF